MKDTIISVKRKKTELTTLLVCFIIANVANLYAIIAYKTVFIELVTSLGYVIFASIILYMVWSVIRLCFWGVRSLVRK